MPTASCHGASRPTRGLSSQVIYFIQVCHSFTTVVVFVRDDVFVDDVGRQFVRFVDSFHREVDVRTSLGTGQDWPPKSGWRTELVTKFLISDL